MQRFRTASLALTTLLLSSALTGLALQADTPEFISIRDQTVVTYERVIDALNRGDADAALQMDTDDWTSVGPHRPALHRFHEDAA